MKKILVIEDEQSLRKDIIEMLTFEGFMMVGAENGRLGISEARRHLPDLIICDIMMPELNGYDVLDALRKDPRTAPIPFIFLTARTDKTDRRQGMERGADDFLTKPFSVKELLASIEMRFKRRAAIEHVSERRLADLRENIVLSMPHELRTPLTVILGFSDILSADTTINMGQIYEMARHINRSALRLYHLVENYLAYAQIETAATDAEFISMLRTSVTNQPRVVIEDQAIQQSQVYDRESDLRLNVANTRGIRVMEDYLRKIVQEVVDNAFKFSEPGTDVFVNGAEDTEGYQLQITNSGRGMTPEQIRDVGAYTQFNRRIHEQQGSGLGLVTSARIAELHGGHLTIESEPDHQTTVTVNLPLP